MQECMKLAEYINTAIWELLVEIAREVEKSNAYGIMSYLDKEKGGTTKVTDKAHLDGIMTMKLHGDYFRQRAEAVNIDLPKSEQWLGHTYGLKQRAFFVQRKSRHYIPSILLRKFGAVKMILNADCAKNKMRRYTTLFLDVKCSLATSTCSGIIK